MKRRKSRKLPLSRQVIAGRIEDLVASGKIITARSSDDMLWCKVDMTEPPDSVLATLGIITMSWGPPIPISLGDEQAVYLFNLVEQDQDSAPTGWVDATRPETCHRRGSEMTRKDMKQTEMLLPPFSGAHNSKCVCRPGQHRRSAL